MNFTASTLQLYAQGSSPFVGIPIAGSGTIVLKRSHLKAALDTKPVRIIYNSDTKILTFRNRRSEWKLNDLLGQGKLTLYQIQNELYAWAKGKRSGLQKRKQTANLGKHGVYVRKLEEHITKLERQRNKIYLHIPKRPLLYQHMEDPGDYTRRAATQWEQQRVIRRKLAKLAGQKLIHGEPKTWADFYRAVGNALGHEVSESQTFSRVHARKRYRHGLPDYPDRDTYLQQLPRYLVLEERPYNYRPFDLYQKDEYGEQLNPLEQHAKARQEYCAALRERMAIESQIAAHRAEIESIAQVKETP